MAHVISSNLQFILLFIYFIIENLKKIFICCIAISNIIVYCITIIPNILNKVADYIKLRVVKNWLT